MGFDFATCAMFGIGFVVGAFDYACMGMNQDFIDKTSHIGLSGGLRLGITAVVVLVLGVVENLIFQKFWPDLVEPVSFISLIIGGYLLGGAFAFYDRD